MRIIREISTWRAYTGAFRVKIMREKKNYLLKRIFIGNVVHEYRAVGHAIVDRAQGVEPFLSGRIPYGQVHASPVEVELFLDERRLLTGEQNGLGRRTPSCRRPRKRNHHTSTGA